MNRYQHIFLLTFNLITIGLFAQSEIEIGQWKSYLPNINAEFITQSPEKIICGTSLSLFTIDKQDGSIEYLSKVEGLTETGLQNIAYDEFNDQLVIAYDNSVVDFVKGADVFPVFDIKENSNFVDRKINDIFIQNKDWVYFATGFGIVQYNLQNFEFGFTLNTNQKINHVSGNDDVLLIAAEDGAYILDYKNEIFPNAFSSWVKLTVGLPTDYMPESIATINGKIYLADASNVYVSDNLSDFRSIYDIPDSNKVVFIKETQDGWMLGLRGEGDLENPATKSGVVFFDAENSLINEITSCTNRLIDAIETEAGEIYFADNWSKLRYIDENGQCHKETFYGPFSQEATDIEIVDNKVYVASGGITENFADSYGRKGIYILDDGAWNNINQDSNPFYKENDLIQHYQVEAHPREPKIYIGSFWGGLIEMNTETGEQILYNASNTNGALGPPVGDNVDRIRISGLTFDNDRNLWISVFGAEKPIAVLTNEGTWHSFPVTSDTKVSDIIVDDNGFVWTVIGGNTGGVFILDPGSSIPDPSDDGPSRFINLNNSELQTSLVASIAKDLDGAIWVGSAEGAIVFECGASVTESICVGNRPTVQVDNIGAYLLATEDVQAIAVDGANRKWFGTRTGIFVQSPSGEEQILKLDEENSPLFDNNIKALAYNPETGEMFISSNKGLQSLKTETTGGDRRHAAEVYAYPNPVRPEYNGPIAIKGLARDAEVLITDVDGQLVFKTDALGGQAIWDGKDLSGNTAAGGVYLVFSSSSESFDDPDTYVTKILVVR